MLRFWTAVLQDFKVAESQHETGKGYISNYAH